MCINAGAKKKSLWAQEKPSQITQGLGNSYTFRDWNAIFSFSEVASKIKELVALSLGQPAGWLDQEKV